MSPPVFVYGFSRSGTSMVCGVLAARGLDFGGDLRLADEYNPRGYWEAKGGRTTLKRFLRQHKFDGDGKRRYPQWVAPPKAIKRLRRAMAPHWAQADALKIATDWLLWGTVHAAYPRARWVIVRRPVPDIVASCMRAPFITICPDGTPEEVWTAKIENEVRLLEALHASPCNTVEVWPDPRRPEVFREAVLHAGAVWDEEAVRAALDPSLWKGAAHA